MSDGGSVTPRKLINLEHIPFSCIQSSLRSLPAGLTAKQRAPILLCSLESCHMLFQCSEKHNMEK